MTLNNKGSMIKEERPKIFRCLECPAVHETLNEAFAHAKELKHWAWGVMYPKEKKK